MPSPILDSLSLPIIQAPMAGGPSTPALTMAVARAGGFGFLAAGYLPVARLQADIEATRRQTTHFGVNLFVPGTTEADPQLVSGYARRLEQEAARAGVELGAPRFDDDSFGEKIDVLVDGPIPVVSFTFGIPRTTAVDRLRTTGSEVWMTVTSPSEARLAADAGADALIVQGVEAGGHRGVFVDDDTQSELSLFAALQLIRAAVDLPLVAAGSLMTGAAVAAVLVAGAAAAQLGTAYLCTVEAGTSDAQRAATAAEAETVLTRAFSGRTARGIRNRFHDEYGADAPAAYPEVNFVTAPLRAHGRAAGDAGVINLWAGQGHQLVETIGAEELTRRLGEEARAAVAELAGRVDGKPLAPVLAAPVVATAGAQHRLRLHLARPNRVVAVITLCLAAGLIPWIVLLALTLPPRYSAGHWRLLWIGYDVAEVGVLAFVAWAAWFRRQILAAASLVAAVLLLSDAWFDIITSWGHRDQWVTLATGLGAEIPLGIFFAWVYRRLVLRSVAAYHEVAHDGVVTSRLVSEHFVFTTEDRDHSGKA